MRKDTISMNRGKKHEKPVFGSGGTVSHTLEPEPEPEQEPEPEPEQEPEPL